MCSQKSVNLIGPALYMKYRGNLASGQRTREGKFVVLKGSYVSSSQKPCCPEPIKNLREKYKNIIKNGKLVENIVFGSASTAASFISASSRNGLLCWHDLKDNRLKDLLEKEK